MTDRYDDEEELLDDEELLDEDDEGVDETVAGVSAWGISIVLHAVVLLLLLFVVFMEKMKEEKAPIKVAVIEPPPEEEEPPEERDIIEQVVTEIEAEQPVENPQVTELDLPVEEVETEDEVVAEVPAKGREEAVATSEAGGAAAFMAMGAGGGASGAFGNRNGGGRKMSVGRFGGSKASESAVEAALRWFARHQSPNGQWDVDGYPANCPLAGAKCEPGTEFTGNDGDVACTGYALLCFLGAGYDHKTPNKWRAVVKGGIDWLVEREQDGVLDDRNYAQGVATMALAEAYGMTNDPGLREPAQRAVDVLLKRQHQGGDGYGMGWDYGKSKERQDSSVTGWCVMALKSAKAGGLNTGNGLEGAKNWLEGAWKRTNPNWKELSPYDRSKFCYAWWIERDEIKNDDRVCIGALCAVFLGYRQGDVLLETLANEIMATDYPRTTSYPTNTYWMYYNTLAIFQVGGERWKQWNDTVRDMLVQAQKNTDDCYDGSWDWVDTRFHGRATGRLLSTAYCCLSLEVYYRYLPVAMKQ